MANSKSYALLTHKLKATSSSAEGFEASDDLEMKKKVDFRGGPNVHGMISVLLPDFTLHVLLARRKCQCGGRAFAARGPCSVVSFSFLFSPRLRPRCITNNRKKVCLVLDVPLGRFSTCAPKDLVDHLR